jgi:hypothetical protein
MASKQISLIPDSIPRQREFFFAPDGWHTDIGHAQPA